MITTPISCTCSRCPAQQVINVPMYVHGSTRQSNRSSAFLGMLMPTPLPIGWHFLNGNLQQLLCPDCVASAT